MKGVFKEEACYCLVRVSATGKGTTPILYRVLSVYASEVAAQVALESYPDLPNTRHYVHRVPYRS